MTKFNKRVTENAHKIFYVAQAYDEKNIVTLSQMFQIPPIEFNAAAWAAVELGMMKINDDNTIELKTAPKEYSFGELVDHLMDIIPFTTGKVNENEADLEEGYFQNWTAGFPQQDVIVATKRLIEEGKLATYDIVDRDVIKFNREERRKRKDDKTEEVIENVYTFYTLPKFVDERWGEKQFKDAKKLQKKAETEQKQYNKEQTQAE